MSRIDKEEVSLATALFKSVQRVGVSAKEPKIQDPMLSLVEEAGEVAQALNVTRHGKRKKLKETAKDECVDVLLCTLELFFDEGGTIEYLVQYMKVKHDRWEKRIQKRKDRVEKDIDIA